MMESVTEKVELQRYPEYKDSGVEWMGEIPENWQVLPGFAFLRERNEKNTGMKESQVLSLSYGNVTVKPVEKLTGLVPESFETYQLVYPGDIIIRPTDLQNDKTSLRTGIAKDKGIITSAYLNLRVNGNNSNKYYHYLLHAIDTNKVIYGLGTGLRQNLSYEDFKRFQSPVPPPEEQTAIAHFLDRKTEQIDQAIEIKQKQIELLKERRQILIHKAVTRGLNPNAPLKPSGVDWIGDIPEQWQVKKLKYMMRINNGKDHSEVVADTGYPVIGSGGRFAYATDYLYDGEALLMGRKGTIDKPLYFKGKFWTVDTMFYAIVFKIYFTKFLFYSAMNIYLKYFCTSTYFTSMSQFIIKYNKILVHPLYTNITFIT